MPDPQLPPRPAPPRRVGQVLAAWFAWFGVARLTAAVVGVTVVVGGAYWLVRTPPPPTEAALPVATAGEPAATLPVPSTTVGQAAIDEAASTVPVVASPATLVIHVAGAVVAPGVYRLDAGDRVHDAVVAAGGAAADAELDGLNLAAPVVDGQRVYVPVVGEVDPAAVPSGPVSPADADGTGASADAPAGPIDLNRADVGALESLPGIGPATAAAIVDDRERNGPFASIDDLDRVPGIGPAKLGAIRELVTV